MNHPKPELLVHATNVTGLGAANLVNSLLDPLCRRLTRLTLVCLPATGIATHCSFNREYVRVLRFRRWLPRAVSRFIECLWPRAYFPETKATLVLGDFPLRGMQPQVVLVHQPNLVKPHVDPLSSRSITFRISRWLFARNLSSVSKVIVQTPVMKANLEASYPQVCGRLVLIPQPAPAWVLGQQPVGTPTPGALSLFYPAAGYPHKNHRLLPLMNACGGDATVLRKITVTLSATEYEPLRNIGWINNAGRLEPDACLAMYRKAHGVFFPSIAESSPLPLAEAMVLGLPVICSDLPYARWMCGEEAIYFNATDPSDAWRAINVLHTRSSAGWQPDWSRALTKFPRDWSEVADRFLALLDESAEKSRSAMQREQ